MANPAGPPAVRSLAPGPLLAPFVAGVELPSDISDAETGSGYTVLPTPWPVLGLQLRGQLSLVSGGQAAPLETLGFTGLQTTSREFVPQADTRTLLLRFRPYGAAALFGPQLADLTDQSVGIAQLLPEMFSERLDARLAMAASERDRARGLIAMLMEALQTLAFPVPGVVRIAADTILRAHGDLSIAALADDLGVGTRQLERGFHACIGLSPKQFAGLARFDWARDRIGGATTLARVAQDAGYADQAQMSRDFAQRTGIAPSRWRAG